MSAHPEPAGPVQRAGGPANGGRVPARLLTYVRGRQIALPSHVTLELIERPTVVEVPGAAYYARGLLKWRGTYLPVVDLYTLLRAYRDVLVPMRYALVVAYQVAPRQPLQHGALALPALPRMIVVDDDGQCPLPKDSDLWPLIAMSCFLHDGRPVPIVDCARIFASPHG